MEPDLNVCLQHITCSYYSFSKTHFLTITNFLKTLNTKPKFHSVNFWLKTTIASKPFYLLEIKQCSRIIHTASCQNYKHYRSFMRHYIKNMENIESKACSYRKKYTVTK